MTLATDIVQNLKAANLTLAIAESCTGGLLAATITEVAGSSAVFDRGFVVYSNDAKVELLGVPQQLLIDEGAVSENTAIAMAQGALARSAADVALALTGIAGPGGSAVKPEGRVCFALCTRNDAPQSETVDFGALGRTQVRAAACDHALKRLLQINSQIG